jgi:hypothetical protein
MFKNWSNANKVSGVPASAGFRFQTPGVRGGQLKPCMKLHAEKVSSAWVLKKDRISDIEQGISNVQGRHCCRFAFLLQIDSP